MRVLDQGEEPMNRLPVQEQRPSEHLRPRSAPGPSDWRRDPARSVGEPDGGTLRPDLPLPPTRAARPTRSRGVFLTVPRWVLDSLKSRRGKVSRVTLALAAVLHTGGVADDDWLARATDWCWRAIATNEQPRGYWLKYACAFLDAVPDEDRAREAIASLAGRVDPSAVTPVAGVEGEALRALDLSPRPHSRSRSLVRDAQIEAHLDAVESEQQEDGGWMFDWLAWSPAQRTDWRGNVTIRALTWLRDNGRL